MPDEFVRYEHSWRQHHPDWELRLWTDGEVGDLVDGGVLARCRNAAERSDVVRYQVLARLGGVYVDTDVECLRPIEPLLDGVRAFAGYAGRRKVGSAVLGAEPGHPAMWAMASKVVRSPGKGSQMDSTGPHLLTRVLADFPTVTIFPRTTFYPYRWYESGRGSEPPDCYAIHRVARSWMPSGDELPRLLHRVGRLEAREERLRGRLDKARLHLERERRDKDAALERARAAESRTGAGDEAEADLRPTTSQTQVEVLRSALDAFNRRAIDDLVSHADIDFELRWQVPAAEERVYRGREGLRRHFEETQDGWVILEAPADKTLQMDELVLALGTVATGNRDDEARGTPSVAWVAGLRRGKLAFLRVFSIAV